MDNQPSASASDLDQQSYLSARDSDHKDLLVYAAKESGRSVLQV
ncbi:hypothetical protein [Halocynthiibacter namhaensis]|nr:hypothetical protein [Halocynthiibacter namhaensis]